MSSRPDDSVIRYMQLRLIEEGETEGMPEGITPTEAFIQRRLMEEEGLVEPEQDRRVERQIASGATEFLDRFGRFLPLWVPGAPLVATNMPSEHLIALLSGGTETAAVRPARGVLQLASDVGGLAGLYISGLEDSINFLERVEQGLLNVAEESAILAGNDPESIAFSYGVGKFFGYTAPVAGSVKIASLLLRAPVTLARWPFAGSLITDTAAGMIFGGVFEPTEGAQERIRRMSFESAMFGAGRLAMGVGIPIKTWRDRRFFSTLAHEEVADVFNRINRGTPLNQLSRRDKKILTTMLNEEQYLSSSLAAQEIFNRAGPEAALVQAIIEQGGNKTAAGVIRSVSDNFEAAQQAVDRLRQQFPHLKFDVISQQLDDVRHYDVFFGIKGLSNKQRAQLKREGRFQGQLVQHSKTGAEYEYLRKHGTDRVLVRRTDGSGKTTVIKEENITDLPNYLESPAPGLDALYQDFRRFYDEGLEELAGVSRGFDEGTLIQGIREGTIPLDPSARRAFDVGGAIAYPEELGEGFIRRMLTPEEVGASISQEGMSGGARVLENVEYLSFDDIFDAWARARGIGGAADLAAARTGFAARLRREMWETVPAAERQLYEQVLAEQLKLIDEGRMPLSAFAHQKGFHMETLPDNSVVLREVNSGARFLFQRTDDASDFLRGITRTEADLPTIIPPLRSGPGIFTGGFPDPGSVWRFDKMVALENFDIPKGRFRNMWNYLQDIENLTGVPIWSKGMEPVDRGQTLMRAAYAPWAQEIERTWRGISLSSKERIVNIWREAEELGVGTAQAARMMKQAGLTGKEVNAFLRSRAMLDRWFKESGIDANRYVQTYYSRIRPFIESTGRSDVTDALRGLEGRPQEFSFWAEFTRTGDLPTVEMDPEVVLHKYIRSLLWRDHVKPHWDRLVTLTGTKNKQPLRFRDLPEDRRAATLAAAKRVDPDVNLDSTVVPEPIRKVLQEYLNSVRGTPHASMQALRDFTQSFFKKLGVKLDPRVGEEFVHNLISMQYGALMGLRPWHVARNITQVPWLMYPRLGNKHMSRGLEKALTREGFEEAFHEGVLRSSEAGIPYADVIFRQIENLPIEATNALGLGVKGAVKALMRTGRISKDMGQKFLEYYSTGDALNRSWAYWWQKTHTDEWLTKFEAGRIGWDKFTSESMAHYSPVVKNQFREILRIHGRERALRYIGKIASDQNNFIYGAGVQPAMLQTWYGRLFGTFGTWPVWAIETMYTQPMKYGSPADKMRFMARVGILGGIFGNIMLQTGYNLWSWIPPLSIMWAGGPYVDMGIALRKVISGTLPEKAAGLREMANLGLRLTVPGIAFYGDIEKVLDQTRTPETRALGLFLGKPFDDEHWALDMVYDPVTPRQVNQTVERIRNEELDPRLLGPAPGVQLPPGGMGVGGVQLPQIQETSQTRELNVQLPIERE